MNKLVLDPSLGGEDSGVSQNGMTEIALNLTRKPSNKQDNHYLVVTGAFTDKEAAQAQVERLKKAGFGSFIMKDFR